jgi:hypothetical protein
MHQHLKLLPKTQNTNFFAINNLEKKMTFFFFEELTKDEEVIAVLSTTLAYYE